MGMNTPLRRGDRVESDQWGRGTVVDFGFLDGLGEHVGVLFDAGPPEVLHITRHGLRRVHVDSPTRSGNTEGAPALRRGPFLRRIASGRYPQMSVRVRRIALSVNPCMGPGEHHCSARRPRQP